jgi:hypothetical protein
MDDYNILVMIQNFFARFSGRIVDIQLKKETTPSQYLGTVSYCKGRSSVEMKIIFSDIHNIEDIAKFAEQFYLDKYEREEEIKIRKNNPTLQNAWEEYQLLLKLIKKQC